MRRCVAASYLHIVSRSSDEEFVLDEGVMSYEIRYDDSFELLYLMSNELKLFTKLLCFPFVTSVNIVCSPLNSFGFDLFCYNDDKSRGHSLHPWLHLSPPRLVPPVSAPR